MPPKQFLLRLPLLLASVALSVAALPAQTTAAQTGVAPTPPKPGATFTACHGGPELDPVDFPAVPIPTLPQTGLDAQAFAPPGWVVKMHVSGDLNGDGKPDLAFILIKNDAKVFPYNPEMLGVAFANPNGPGYTLALQNSTLICRFMDSDMWGHDAIFGDDGGSDSSLKFADGAFSLQFQSRYQPKMNSSPDGAILTFRYQHSRFELIKYEGSAPVGKGGNIDYVAQTFITRASANAKPKTHALAAKPLYSIEEVGDEEQFDPKPVAAVNTTTRPK